MLVAIEGIDGAGKGTLTRHLLARAGAAGVKAATLSFPRYEETRFSALIAQYLNGRFGALDEVPVRFASLLYAGDRFESRDLLLGLLADNDLVILDRYVASNIAYNAAKVPADERPELIGWIEETEYGTFGLPRPDLTCLVTTRPALAHDLVARKEVRSYTDRSHDLHEADRDFMTKVADVYDRLADAGGEGWVRINPMDGDRLRLPDDIAGDAWDKIARRLGRAAPA
jgi:dTMP kinase